jgi:adenosylhomocysteine nucleosidase
LERSPILILAALEQEVAPLRRALRHTSLRLIKTGVGPHRAAAAVRRHLLDARHLVSTGCCGALHRSTPPGTIVLPRRVILCSDAATIEAPPPDPSWHAAARRVLEEEGLPFSTEPLVTVPEALVTSASKLACHQRTGGVAVDMETAAIAQVAAEGRVPYLAIRVVLDAVDEDLPELPLRPDGSVDLRRLPGALIRPRVVVTMASLALRLRGLSVPLARVLKKVLLDPPIPER